MSELSALVVMQLAEEALRASRRRATIPQMEVINWLLDIRSAAEMGMPPREEVKP